MIGYPAEGLELVGRLREIVGKARRQRERLVSATDVIRLRIQRGEHRSGPPVNISPGDTLRFAACQCLSMFET